MIAITKQNITLHVFPLTLTHHIYYFRALSARPRNMTSRDVTRMMLSIQWRYVMYIALRHRYDEVRGLIKGSIQDVTCALYIKIII